MWCEYVIRNIALATLVKRAKAWALFHTIVITPFVRYGLILMFIPTPFSRPGNETTT